MIRLPDEPSDEDQERASQALRECADRFAAGTLTRQRLAELVDVVAATVPPRVEALALYADLLGDDDPAV